MYFVDPYYRIVIDKDGIRFYSDSIRSKGKELAQWVTNDYLHVSINKKSVAIHKIIARCAYGERPEGFVINHIDANKLNNHPSNLEYCTVNENIQHSIRMGMHVANDPTRSGRYKDGRATKDKIAEYKHQHYLDNMATYKERGRLHYLKRKAKEQETLNNGK